MATLGQLQLAGTDMIRRGLTWWLGELRAMLPERLFRQPHNAATILEVTAESATLLLADRRGAAQRIPLDPLDPDGARRVAAAMRGRSKGGMVIRLDQSLLLQASLTLPGSAESSLRQIVYHQLDRVVPLAADDVYYECRVARRSAETKTLTVDVIVATHESVDRAVALARSAGLAPRVAIAGGVQPPMIIWRAVREAIVSPMRRRLQRALEFAAILLLLATYGAYIYRLDAVAEELQFEVSQATRVAAKVRQLTQRHAQTEDALDLLERYQRMPSPLSVLNSLTELVPPTMWINQLIMRGTNLELIGISPRVNELISRINNSDLFYNVQFRSPVTRSLDGKGDRFDVSFDVWVEQQ